ncbi:DUF1353 domain-containing protein [Aureimonas sp. AU40]|uniref:DUF1353 domain-containing protein n=1 Tax=Aureimonas sp. AU40 TaxID=1637747 RepID=UPI00078217D2|nr:DUF1353 domain-containing protein [Aureimonas sp. AU40]
MSVYTEPGLRLDFFDGQGRDAKLLEPIEYEREHKGSGRWVIVPVGFVTDGATVPRCLWWFLPPWGTRESKAAVVHDFLLSMGVEWREAARELRTALIAIGVSPVRAEIVYRGVLAKRHIDVWVSFASRFC